MDSSDDSGNLAPLKQLLCPPADRARYGLAALAGVLLALAFPKINLAGLAWVAPGLMLAAALGVDGRMAFRLGYVSGLAYFLTTLSWLLHIPVMKLAPITGWLALSGFLSLYSGAWVWLCWKCFPANLGEAFHLPRSAVVKGGAGEALAPRSQVATLLDGFLATNWLQRVVWSFTCAALWVAWEMVQGRLFSGFPWTFLGVSQHQMLPLIQIAKFTGVYGVSFLAVWFSVSMLCAAVVVLRQSENARRWMGEIIVPLVVVIGVATLGLRQSFRAPDNAATLRIALVQPSIPQQWIWSPAESSNRFVQLIQTSGLALATKPDLLVWPEASVPGFLRWTPNVHDTVTNLVRAHQTWLVLGADDAEPSSDPRQSEHPDVFNASFLVSPAGELVANYRKRKLVIFGEYLPFVRWLPFLERWTGMGSFTPGREVVAFRVPELRFKTSVLICFEDVFPHVAREHVEPDTDFLLNLTNNGWFGESAAQWQHAANAVFRAVENGLPLVRCANNGLTCWVDARGQMHDVFFPGTKDIYGAGFKVVEVPLLGGQTRAPTFYRKHGDLFGWACVAWSALVAVNAFARRRRGARGERLISAAP